MPADAYSSSQPSTVTSTTSIPWWVRTNTSMLRVPTARGTTSPVSALAAWGASRTQTLKVSSTGMHMARMWLLFTQLFIGPPIHSFMCTAIHNAFIHWHTDPRSCIHSPPHSSAHIGPYTHAFTHSNIQQMHTEFQALFLTGDQASHK